MMQIEAHRKGAKYLLMLKGVFLFLIGLYFAKEPENAVRNTASAIGIFLIIAGLLWSYNTYRRSRLMKLPASVYFNAFSTVLAGILLLYFGNEFLTLLFIILGVWILVMGISQIKLSGGFDKNRMVMSRTLLLMGIFTVLVGLITLLNPQGMIHILTVLFGISLMLAGVIMFILGIKTN